MTDSELLECLLSAGIRPGFHNLEDAKKAWSQALMKDAEWLEDSIGDAVATMTDGDRDNLVLALLELSKTIDLLGFHDGISFDASPVQACMSAALVGGILHTLLQRIANKQTEEFASCWMEDVMICEQEKREDIH